MNEGILASRSGETSPLGKLTEPLNLMLSEPTKSGIAALAAIHGVTPSEYVRAHLDDLVHGKLPMLRASCRRNDSPSMLGIQRDGDA